jgi:hypothetical protein
MWLPGVDRQSIQLHERRISVGAIVRTASVRLRIPLRKLRIDNDAIGWIRISSSDLRHHIDDGSAAGSTSKPAADMEGSTHSRGGTVRIILFHLRHKLRDFLTKSARADCEEEAPQASLLPGNDPRSVRGVQNLHPVAAIADPRL